MKIALIIILFLTSILLMGCIKTTKMFNPSGFEDNGSRIMTITDNPVNITGDLNVVGNITGNEIYGEMHFHSDEATGHTIPIASSGVYVNVTGFNGTDSDVEMTQIFTNGFTFINESNALRCDIGGRYLSYWKLSTGNAGNNQEYQTVISVADVRQEITEDHRKIGAAGDVGSLSGGGSFICNSGDIINLQTRNNDGTADLQIHVGLVTIKRIGD